MASDAELDDAETARRTGTEPLRWRGRIWLGDLAAALCRLRPSPEAEVAIVQILGLPRAAAETADMQGAKPTPEKKSTPPVTRRSPQDRVIRQPTFVPAAIDLEVIAEETSEAKPTSVLIGVEALEQGLPEDTLPDPRLDPLFRPEWTRALLSGALSTEGGQGAIDFDRLAEMLASLNPVERLPRFPVPTLRRGVQVLVDRGECMQPFLGDQERILVALSHVIGKDRVIVMGFAGSPLRGTGAGSQWEWRSYAPPGPGTPVLLLTDLGIQSSGADESEWLEFSGALKHSGNPLVALVPYPPERWPRRLAGAIDIIPWDGSTTISAVRRIIGPTLAVRR